MIHGIIPPSRPSPPDDPTPQITRPRFRFPDQKYCKLHFVKRGLHAGLSDCDDEIGGDSGRGTSVQRYEGLPP